jgi:hypothetical protein
MGVPKRLLDPPNQDLQVKVGYCLSHFPSSDKVGELFAHAGKRSGDSNMTEWLRGDSGVTLYQLKCQLDPCLCGPGPASEPHLLSSLPQA